MGRSNPAIGQSYRHAARTRQAYRQLFAAKQDGICARCFQPIRKGDPIRGWFKRWAHGSCP